MLQTKPAKAGFFVGAQYVQMGGVIEDNRTPVERKRELYRLAMARHDFQVSFDACAAMAESVDTGEHPLYFHLYCSAVVAYSKPFVHSKKVGALPGRWRKFPQPWMGVIHEQATKARNEVIAHNDPDVRSMWVTPGALQPSAGERSWPVTPTVRVSSYSLHLDFFPGLADVCRFQMLRLTESIDTALYQIYDLSARAIEPFKIDLNDL